MPYVNILDRNTSYSYHRGVSRGIYLCQNEFMSLFEKVRISGKLLLERAEEKSAEHWRYIVLSGQHEAGQSFLRHSPTEHVYELRGRLIVHEV